MSDPRELAEGLTLVRDGDGFAAHEVFELLWRAAPAGERDFYQGLVHVAVATYQERRGNPVGRERQLHKAQRRLAAYAPQHLGVDVTAGVVRRLAGRGHLSSGARLNGANRCAQRGG